VQSTADPEQAYVDSWPLSFCAGSGTHPPTPLNDLNNSSCISAVPGKPSYRRYDWPVHDGAQAPRLPKPLLAGPNRFEAGQTSAPRSNTPIQDSLLPTRTAEPWDQAFPTQPTTTMAKGKHSAAAFRPSTHRVAEGWAGGHVTRIHRHGSSTVTCPGFKEQPHLLGCG